ncbi:MAG: carbohydrate porin [Sphingomonadaceae bacterium]|nr:carbohydrate porin [Sphingomonadaceae bacterium]
MSAAPRARMTRLAARGLVAMLALLPAAARADDAAHDGLTIAGGYVADTLADVSGGIDRGVTQLGKADLTATWTGQLAGIDGATAYVDLEYVHGRSFSTYRVGDVQTVSNVDAVSALRPFEVWLQLPFAIGRGKAAAKLGLIDLNGTFDVQDVGHLFLNSSHGIGPDFSRTGRNGPSIFPTTSPAATFTFDSVTWSARFGVFEAEAGDPDHPTRTVIRRPGDHGLLLVAEVERRIGPNQVQFGAWSYTGRFPALTETDARGDPRAVGGDHGAYALIEGRLAGRDEGMKLEGWVRIGVAAARMNPIGVYAGGGLAYGDVTGRLGLAIAHARLGNAGDAAFATDSGPPHRAETDIEVTYNRRVMPWLRVQPDAQYVVHPGWRRDLGNATVLGLRLIVSPF